MFLLLGSYPIRTSLTTDGAAALCGLRPYLGVQIDVSLPELDDTNNYAWQQVIFHCPNLEGK